MQQIQPPPTYFHKVSGDLVQEKTAAFQSETSQHHPFTSVADAVSAVSHVHELQICGQAIAMPPPPPGPALGSCELPSKGSVGHSRGRCKPCAFFHNRGCENGIMCEFCHLCVPGEKKRRHKEKVANRRKFKQALMSGPDSNTD